MALGWELCIPLPASLSFIILVLLVSGILEVFSWYRSQKRVAPKRKASKQQTQKLTASQAEEARLRFIGGDEVTGITGFHIDWTQQYALWTVYKRLGRILRQLENARVSLVEQSLPDSQTVSSSSVFDFVAQEAVSPGCCCRKGKHSSEYSTSSGSSNNSSSLSYLPVLSEGTTSHFPSNSGPVSPPKAHSVSRNQGTPQTTFKMTDPENSGVFQDLSAHPPLHGPNSILNESPGPPVRSPLQFSPFARGDLERHISQKFSALRKQPVPLPVKKSWDMLNDLAEVPGVSEQERPKTQLPTPIPQRAEKNTYRSPGVSSLHLPKKDPKHVSEQSIEQRVIGLPEKRVHPQKAQVPRVELAPKMPYSAKDSMRVTPLPLRQVVDLMGISPEPHSEVIKSVRFPPKPSTPGQPHQDMDPSKFTPWRKDLDYSEVSSWQSHKVVKTEVLTSRTWPQMKTTLEMAPSHHQGVRTTPGAPDKGAAPIVMSQQHPVTESKVVPATLPLQGMGYLGGHTIPQPKLMDSVNLPWDSQDIKYENPVLDPRLQSMKSVDITTDLVPERAKHGLLISTMVSTNLAPELHQQNVHPEELTPIPQSQCKNSMPSAPESQLQGVKSGSVQSVPESRLQGVKAGSVPSAPESRLQGVKSGSAPSAPESRLQGVKSGSAPSAPESHLQGVKSGSAPSAPESRLQGVKSDSAPSAPESQLQGVKTGSAPSAPEPQLQGVKSGSAPSAPESHLQGVKSGSVPSAPESHLQGVKSGSAPSAPEPHLQDVKSSSAPSAPEPHLQGVKSGSAPSAPEFQLQGVKSGSLPSAPESHLQGVKSGSAPSAPESRLQGVKSGSAPSAPESHLQGVKSGSVPSAPESQLRVGAQPQSVQPDGSSPDSQLQRNISVDLNPGSQSQGMEYIHSAAPQELQGDINMVELTPRSSLEDAKSVNLAPKQCSQNISSDKVAHITVLEDMKVSLVEGTSLIPEALVETVKVDELIPSTHLDAVKLLEVSPNSSHHIPEPEGLTLQQQASKVRVTSATCHQMVESLELTRSSLAMTPAPLTPNSESMELSLPPLQEALETQAVKGRKETPQSRHAVKNTPDLLPKSEVPNISSEGVAPDPQPPDVKLAHVTLESHSEVTNSSEITLRSEHENPVNIRLMLPKLGDTQGTTAETYSEVGSLGLTLEPGARCERSESLAQNLKSSELSELTSELSTLVVEPTELTTGPKPHIKDAVPGPQLHKVRFRQLDTESQLPNEQSVSLTQLSSRGVVEPEKANPETWLQGSSLKELMEGTQPSKVKSMNLNVDPQQPIVKSELIPGPQLQSVRFQNSYQELNLQGETPANFISDPSYHPVRPDDVTSFPPWPGIKLTDFFSDPNALEAQPHHVTPVEVNRGPSLHTVKLSDLTPEPKHHGFKNIQFIPGVQLQERKSQGFTPQSFWPLRQEPPLDNRKLALPTEGWDLSRMKSATQASEVRYPNGMSLGVSPGLWQQDTTFSDLAPGPKLEGVKFGKQRTGLVLTGVTSETPQLVTHVPKLTKMTPGLQDTRQANFNSGPRLKDVKFFDAPRTQLQGVKTSELNSGPRLESVKISEWTEEPERQRMKPELTAQESLFQGIKHVTGNQVPGFEDKMPYRGACDPHIANAGSMRLNSGVHLAHADHSELIRRPQAQGIGSSELIQGPVEVSKREKLTAVEMISGPNLGAMKSMQLRPSSELGQVKCMLSATGMQAGDRKQDRESVISTPGQCLGRTKSTVVSPTGSQAVDIKTVRIPGTRIQDLKIMGLFGDIQPQDANAMGFKLESQKHGEHPVTSVPGLLSQENPIEGAQGPQLQGTEPQALTSQPQITDRKYAVTSCLEQQSLKPGAVAKIQEIQGMEFAELVSRQQRQGMEPICLTPVPGLDGQILINSPEWKHGIFNQLNKQFDSDQESKPADVKSREINSKVQFKDLSFELAPKPAVHSVEGSEQQHGIQVPSVKPCQLTPASQIHQAKASELRFQPQWSGVKTVVLTTESQTGSTKTTQWVPLSEFQSEKCRGSNLRSQSQGVGPPAPEPSTQWGGVRSSELTDRSKGRGEKSVAFHLEPQLQHVKTSPLATGLQKPKTFNLTSEPQPQGLKTAEVTEEPRVESVRSVQWIPGPEFHGAKFLGLNCGLPSQGVKSTERKQPTLLGVGKSPEVILGPKHQGKKSVDFKPGPELKRGEKCASTSEPQPQGVKTVPLQHGTQLENTKPVQWSPLSDFQFKKSMLNLGVQSTATTHKELKPSVQPIDEKTSDTLTTRPKIQGKQPSMPAQEYSSHEFKSIDFNFDLQFKKITPCDPALRSKVSDIKPATFKPRFHCEDTNSAELTPRIQPQEVKPVGSRPRTQTQDVTSLVLKPESQSSQVKRGVFSQRPQSQNSKNTELKSAKVSELALQTKPHGRKPEPQSGSQWQSAKCPDLTPETKSQKMKCVKLSHSSPLKGKPFTDITTGTRIQNEIKPSLKLEGEKPDFTPRKLFLGTKSVGLDSRTHLQESKYPELVMGTKLQGADAVGQHFASIKSSQVVTPTKSQSGTSVNFSFGPQTLNKNPSELVQGTETELLDESSLEFKPERRLQGRKSCEWSRCKNVMSSHTGMADGDSSELHPRPDLQGIKSKVFCLGPHFEDVNSACSPNTNSQYINSSRCTPGSHWQASKSPCIAEPSPQCINLVCTPAPHLHGMNSSTCLSGSKLHCIDSTVCNSKPRFQNVNSSASSLGSSPQCAKSAKCKPEAHFQSVSHSSSIPSVPIESQDQIINYVSISAKPLDQMFKSVLIPKPVFLMAKPEDLAPGPCPQVIEPIGVTTRSSIKVTECLDLLPRPHLQEQETPMELTPRATVEMHPAEFILQQTPPPEEPTVLTHEQRLHAESPLGLKTESPKAVEIEDLNEELVCPNSNKKTITSEKLQAENYFSRFTDSPSNPFITSSVKSTEFGHLQGSGIAKVSRTLSMKNLGVGILQPAQSYTDSIIFKLSALLLALHNQPRNKAENTVGAPYPEMWERDLISKEGAEKKHKEEFGGSLQSASPYPLRFLPEEFQTGLGTRRSPLRSFLGRRQNVWESHVCRQRLPRKYLSSMLMLGSVLGSTMERKLCSHPFLTEGSTMEICRSIQNLFGVPDELMECSQRLLERGPRTVSQNSVKNYIQRHICCHKKRTPLKTWTRGSTSSIIRQYSGTRLGIKKTDSKLSQTFQEVPQQEPASCSGPQSPALVRPESTLGIFYNMDDHPLSRKESKTSQNDSQARTSETLTANSLPLANTDISEQLKSLKELKLKVAAKLLRSQIPNNVPLPPSSGLVLKYPTCLKCGRWSGIKCYHKFQSAFGPYLLIYPTLHLVRTPKGHGEIRCHLAFRVEPGKRPQISKYRRRNRAGPRKGTTLPPRRKPKTSKVASTSPALKRDFQSSTSPSAASVQGHMRQTQWGSRGVGAKTEAKDYKICQDGTRDKSRLRKSSPLKYPKKTTTKGPKTENTNLYKNSRMTEENPPGTRTDLSKNKSITPCQESTSSSKKQPEKSSKPRFIQLPFQGLRSKILQKSLRILRSFRQKLEDRTRPDNSCSSKNMRPKQKAKDSCPTRASTPVAKHRATGLIPKQENILQETSEQCTQAQQSKHVNTLQPRPLQLQKTMISKRDVSIQDKDSSQAKKNYSDEIPISELKSHVGAEFQAQEKIVADSPLKKTLQSNFKEKRTQEEEHHGFFGERALCYKSERPHRSLSERTPRNVSQRRNYSPSQRKHSSPSDRTLRSLPDRRHRSPAHQSLFKERGHSQSERRQPSPSQRSRQSPSGRSPQSPSGRNLCDPPERRGHSPSAKSPHSLSGRSQQSSSPQRCPSPSKSFYVNLTQRTGGSSLERAHGRLSEKNSSSPSGRKSHTSSERTPYLICNNMVHRPSSKLIRRPEQTHSSPEPFSSHSERSQSSPTDIDTQLLWSRLYAQAGHESGSGSSWCHLGT